VRTIYEVDSVSIIWEDRGIVAYYAATFDHEAHEVFLGATVQEACDALRGQGDEDIAEIFELGHTYSYGHYGEL